jgi:hypothetical protein
MSLRSLWREARQAAAFIRRYEALGPGLEMFTVPAGTGPYLPIANVVELLEALAIHYEHEGELVAALALRQVSADIQEGKQIHDALDLEVGVRR